MTRRRAVRGQPWIRIAAWSLLWLVVSAFVVLPYLVAYPELSPIDETQHVDYLVKIQDGEVLNGGERLGQEAMRETACRGMDLEGVVLPDCDKKRFKPEKFPGEGFNYTYGDPPTYYLLTAPVAALVDALPGIDSVVTAGRSVGVLWLAGGLGVTYLLCRRLGADRLASLGVTLVVAATPVVTHSVATITTDAPMLLVGGGLLLTGLAVADRRIAWWWLVPVTVGAVAIKLTVLSAVGLVALFLLLRLLEDRRRSRARGPRADPVVASDHAPEAPAEEPVRQEHQRTGLLALAALLVSAAVVLGAWTLLSAALAQPGVDENPIAEFFAAERLRWDAIASAVPSLFTPVVDAYTPDIINTSTSQLLVKITNVAFIVGPLALAWFGTPRVTATRLASATSLAMALGGPVFVVVLYVTSHVTYGIPGRYGLALLPAVAACTAVVAGRRKAGSVAMVALGLISLGVLLGATLTG